MILRMESKGQRQILVKLRKSHIAMNKWLIWINRNLILKLDILSEKRNVKILNITVINDKTSELVKILQSLKTKYGTQSSRAPVGNQQRPPPPNHQPISKVNPNVN